MPGADFDTKPWKATWPPKRDNHNNRNYSDANDFEGNPHVSSTLPNVQISILVTFSTFAQLHMFLTGDLSMFSSTDPFGDLPAARFRPTSDWHDLVC